MKFIAKNSNLLIVLRQGIPGSHITGTPSIPMVSARFKDGVFDTDSQTVVEMLLAHPAFGTDFISAEDTQGIDPFAYLREPTEPEHLTTSIKNGQPVGSGKPAKINFPPEVKQALQEQALEMAKAMAKEMAPYMAAEYLKQAVGDHQAGVKPTGEALETPVAPVKKGGKKAAGTTTE